jgi:hypothetical protein
MVFLVIKNLARVHIPIDNAGKEANCRDAYSDLEPRESLIERSALCANNLHERNASSEHAFYFDGRPVIVKRSAYDNSGFRTG